MKKWLVPFILLLIGGAVSYYDVVYMSKNITAPFEAQTPVVDKTKEIGLEQVNNLGYTFYVGQINNPSTAPISDILKNDITRVIYNAKFPKSILEKTPIVFVNNLALKPGQYIAAPGGDMVVPTFGPDFLYEGGVYGTYQSGRSIIYLNNDVFPKVSLNDVLTHELGHAIGKTLTDADWTKYYQLREIASGTPRYGSNWNLSPAEDFAEVYKNTFTGLDIKTYYGLGSYRGFFERTCKNIQTQSCRQNIMMNPSKYPDDFRYGTPYKSVVSQSTKDFINAVISKQN
jgi:hypothetical protein